MTVLCFLLPPEERTVSTRIYVTEYRFHKNRILKRRISRFYLGTWIVPLEIRLTTLIAELISWILPSDTQVLSVVSDREGLTSTIEFVHPVTGLTRNVAANRE